MKRRTYQKNLSEVPGIESVMLSPYDVNPKSPTCPGAAFMTWLTLHTIRRERRANDLDFFFFFFET